MYTNYCYSNLYKSKIQLGESLELSHDSSEVKSKTSKNSVESNKITPSRSSIRSSVRNRPSLTANPTLPGRLSVNAATRRSTIRAPQFRQTIFENETGE